eukprot:10335032-Alexandrium_andersonii.AAC.1
MDADATLYDLHQRAAQAFAVDQDTHVLLSAGMRLTMLACTIRHAVRVYNHPPFWLVPRDRCGGAKPSTN